MKPRSTLSLLWCALAIMGLGLVAGSAALGQESAPAEMLALTPTEAGEMAARSALPVLAADEAVRQAQAAIGQAASGGGLSLQMNGVYGRTGPVQTAELNGQSITLGSPTIFQYSLSLTQPLYTGGRVPAAVSAARSGVTAAQQQVEATRLGMRLAAQEAAYQVLRAQELAGVAQRQTKSVREHLRIAQAMFDAGTVAQFEVIQAQTQLAQAEGNEIAALTGVQQALAALRQILVLEQTRPLTIVPSTDPVTRPAGDLPALIEQGWQQRPELAALQARVKQAESGVRLAKAGRNLALSLGGQFTKSQGSLFSAGETWQVTVAASKPIFDGGLTRSNVASAESQLKQAQLAVDSQKQQVALDVTQPFLSLDQATKQVQVATQGVINARERARVAEVRFGAGVTNGIEVLDANTALAAAEAAQINANYDLQLALVRLYEAVGQPLSGGEKQ